MSVSTFHRHFRAVTAMSAPQYQKQIRLQEARARLTADAKDVAAVGFDVGYESLRRSVANTAAFLACRRVRTCACGWALNRSEVWHRPGIVDGRALAFIEPPGPTMLWTSSRDGTHHAPVDARRYSYDSTYMMRGVTELHLEFTPVDAR